VINLRSAIGPPMLRRQHCRQKVDSSLTAGGLYGWTLAVGCRNRD
jgi:hypothetical protein